LIEAVTSSHPLFHGDGLFSHYYLTHRLPTADFWAEEAEANNAYDALRSLYLPLLSAIAQGNEEDVEDKLVAPTLTRLGFGYQKRRIITVGASRHIPDFLLYNNSDDADAAFQNGSHYAKCIGLLEAKRWGVALEHAATRKDRSPHLQLRDYLNERPEIGWGIVTNGSEWRLYAREAAASQYLSFSLAAILSASETDPEARFAFRLFYTLFRRDAFAESARHLSDARVGADRFREEIEAQLRLQVFDATETLAQGFLAHVENKLGEADLSAVFDNTLILLYRILFVLNAEARDLLPTDSAKAYFKSFGIESVRRKLANRETAAEYEEDGTFALWGRFDGLFRLINGDDGDRNERLEVPRYNGGLFDPRNYPALQRWRVADKYLAAALQTLTFRREPGGAITAFDYAGLGERHLGSIYEGLLEHRLAFLKKGEAGENDVVSLRNDKGERKAQGAYYTPQEFVAYLVNTTLTPLLQRIEESAAVQAQEPDSFAEAVLRLNVCDPAMGSGHFLVEATAMLSEAVAAHKTTVTGDLAYWKRRVVEACIYGVDRNPLAVELAKLSLWLKTVDRVPLNFLDHHLRCGNSLIGTTFDALPRFPNAQKKRTTARKGDIVQLSMTFAADLQAAVADAIARIHTIESTATDTHAVAKQKEKSWRELAETVLPRFTAIADLWTVPYFGGDLNWLRYQQLLDDPDKTLEARADYAKLLDDVKPYHWELAFPDVFFDERGNKKADPGFDAVIGNPPWERIKLAENEFFSRHPAIAGATRASDRKAIIAALPQTDPDLWAAYTRAKTDADRALAYVQNSGFYPLMGRGDTNLYAVFVEKATQIAARNGRVGLLVPSGIATDNTTSHFFRHIVLQQRLSELLDFQNGNTFPDVDSRFKFSILVIAGDGDPQVAARCGFFLRAISDLDDEARTFPLTPADFATFNPNTLTCPIFRRREDAELTRKLYAAAPILRKIAPVASSADSETTDTENSWNVRFLRMFDMTNDSAKFKTYTELDTDGFWMGDGNLFTKGDVRYLPLYEGKMVQMYDHRAASVKINLANQFRAAQEDPSTPAQHADPNFSVLPQYWVNEEEVLLSVSNVPPMLLNAYRVRDPNPVRQALMLWAAGWKANTGEEDIAVKIIGDAFSTQTALAQILHYENAKKIEKEYPWSLINQATMTQLVLDEKDKEDNEEGKEQQRQEWLAIAKTIIEANKPAFSLAFKDVTAPTNKRTIIAAAIPCRGAGHNFPLMLDRGVIAF
jgi:hypothetical protein